MRLQRVDVRSQLLRAREEVREDLLAELEGEFQEGKFGRETGGAAGAVFEVGPGFVAVEKSGIVCVVVVGEGCGGEVGGYVVVAAVVGACVHGGEVEGWHLGWAAPGGRGALGNVHLAGIVVCWRGGYV